MSYSGRTNHAALGITLMLFTAIKRFYTTCRTTYPAVLLPPLNEPGGSYNHHGVRKDCHHPNWVNHSLNGGGTLGYLLPKATTGVMGVSFLWCQYECCWVPHFDNSYGCIMFEVEGLCYKFKGPLFLGPHLGYRTYIISHSASHLVHPKIHNCLEQTPDSWWTTLRGYYLHNVSHKCRK